MAMTCGVPGGSLEEINREAPKGATPAFSVLGVLAKPKDLAFLYDFKSPESTTIGRIKLGELISSVTKEDEAALGGARAEAEADNEAQAFDRFVAGIRVLVTGDYAAAECEFANVQSKNWWVAASILRSIALAAAGEFCRSISLANQIGEVLEEAALADAPTYLGDRALLRQAVTCLQAAEEACPTETEQAPIDPEIRYVVGYPRSGNTMLGQFLSFTFAAPNYSVYPVDGWYFSRRFHDRTPGHLVFVKDHVLRSEYLDHQILSPLRDGRVAVVSLARYLYGEGSSRYIRRGELADFITYLAERMPYGFWGQHTRNLLAAQEQGARIHILRYEEFFGQFQRLVALVGEILSGNAFVRVDEEKFQVFVERRKLKLSRQPQWSDRLKLPEDSFIPPHWSIGKGTIDWRSAFDAQARLRFHDLGGTEMLVRLGYETDEDWWRQS